MNPIFSRSRLLAAFIGLILFTACSNYGKKVTFSGSKNEVFYKSEGVTEADANAVGKFLTDEKIFMNDDKKRSVQISKNNNRIEVRFVLDDKAATPTAETDEVFATIGTMLSKQVFNNLPVDVIYTDETFKDKKTIAFKPEVLENKKEPVNDNARQTSYNSDETSPEEKAINDEIAKMGRKDYKENTLYYGDRISDDEAQKLAEYFKTSGFFTETGNNDILVNKLNNNDPFFRFSIKASANNEETLQTIDNYVKKLKAEFFEKESLRFEVLDDHMRHIKTFSY